MKCVHCSKPVERKAWFCPNCKRSVRSTRERSTRQRWIIGVSGALGVAVVASALAAFRFAPAGTPSQPEASPAPVATTQEAPVIRITPGEDDEKRETSDAAPVAQAAAPDAAPDALPPVSPDAPLPAAPDSGTPAVQQPSPPAPSGTGALTITTSPPVRTFVYLDGGKLLGEAPLRNAAVPAGRHTLVFWAPSIGGRSAREVVVEAGASVSISERIEQRSRFVDAGSGDDS